MKIGAGAEVGFCLLWARTLAQRLGHPSLGFGGDEGSSEVGNCCWENVRLD